MTTAFYRTGTVAVTQNSKVVTGTGTNWTTGPTKPLAGDVFIFNNKMYEIDSVVSDTEIRLYRNFEDSTASSKSYAIMRNASLNISARIAAQVAQVVNQKQIMVDEFHDFLTNNTDSTVPLTDTLGNKINVTPIPMLDKDYVEKIGGIDSAVNQAVQDINDAFDNFEYPVLTAVQRQAIVDANEEEYAASGIVHMGLTGSTTGLINEGLIATPIATPYANKLYLGAPEYTDNRIGTSKNEYSTQHIAGVVSEFVTGRSGDNAYSSQAIQLPPAPDGTVIYDSTGDARGTGKANLKLLTEVDPKYGDSAEDLYGVGTVAAKNEASARAFEGQVRNGNLRDGTNYWKTVNTGAISAVDGVLTVSNNQQAYGGAATNSFLTQAVTYKVVVQLGVVVGHMNVLLRGRGSYTKPVGSSHSNTKLEFEVVCTEGSTWFQTESINNTGDNSIQIRDIAVTPVTEEVVTDRVDMFGLEQFDMVMKDGEIFDMIQSQATTFGDTGVPTVTSVRPDSFFATYDGQENIVKGKCVRWPDLTVEQKRKVAVYMKERLWVNEDGDLTFTSIRQRSFAGAGNGDWYNISPISGVYLRSVGGLSHYVRPQGNSDDSLSFGISNPTYRTFDAPNNSNPYKGVFTVDDTKGSALGYKGRCFFYVLGTVSRLNQGAYHPSLNPAGCGRWVNEDNNRWRYWYSSDVRKASGTAPLFTDHSVGGVTASDTTGRVGSSEGSGRPDGRFYDAIYADGLGGVVDRRLPAYESDSPEEAAKVWEKVKNKTYRGLEKLIRTRVSRPQANGDHGQATTYLTSLVNKANVVGGTLSIVNDGVLITQENVITKAVDNNNGTMTLTLRDKIVRTNYSATGQDVITYPLNLSVSGEFTQTDVIGDPANILQTDALKNGWLGSWIPVTPDGTPKDFPLTRKSLISNHLSKLYTLDLGTTWTAAGNKPVDTVENTNTEVWATSTVGILNYTAFAKQTKESTNKPVLNGDAGVGSVYATSSSAAYYGVLLHESLVGNVGKHNQNKTFNVTKYLIDNNNEGKIAAFADTSPGHTPLDFVAPFNNSPAVKALPYQISNSGQCSLGVQANALSYVNLPPTATDIDGTVGVNITKGKLYRVSVGKHTGLVLRCSESANNVIMDNQLLGRDGKFYSVSSGGQVTKFSVWDGSGWGDDGTMKITNSGSDTFVDLNGNTNLSVVHELALPYGWTKNRARAGEQTEGVDL